MLFVELNRDIAVALKKNMFRSSSIQGEFVPCECCLCVFLNYKMGTKYKNPVCMWQLGQSRKADKSWYSELLAVLEALKSRSKRHPISWLLKWDVLLYFILFPGNTSHWMNVPHLDKSIPILPPPVSLCNLYPLHRICLQLFPVSLGSVSPAVSAPFCCSVLTY